MKQNIEIEAKYIVCKDDFIKLTNHFKLDNLKRTCQVNEYFDTPNRQIRDKKMMLRIRTIDNHHELTLKIPKVGRIIEHNQDIDEEKYDEIKSTGVIENLPIPYVNYVPIGILTTYRISIPYLDGELFFDENHYSDYVDYEIEYEVSDSLENAEKKLQDLFAELRITNYNKSASKMRRCCN